MQGFTFLRFVALSCRVIVWVCKVLPSPDTCTDCLRKCAQSPLDHLQNWFWPFWPKGTIRTSRMEVCSKASTLVLEGDPTGEGLLFPEVQLLDFYGRDRISASFSVNHTVEGRLCLSVEPFSWTLSFVLGNLIELTQKQEKTWNCWELPIRACFPGPQKTLYLSFLNLIHDFLLTQWVPPFLSEKFPFPW